MMGVDGWSAASRRPGTSHDMSLRISPNAARSGLAWFDDAAREEDWRLEPSGARPNLLTTHERDRILRRLRQSGMVRLRLGRSGEPLTDPELCAAGLLVFDALVGTMAQYDDGTIVARVEDVSAGKGLTHYSKSSAHGLYHTDGTMLAKPPTYVGLLCSRPARQGGETCLIPVKTLVERVVAEAPQAAEILEQMLPFASSAENGVCDVRWAHPLSKDRRRMRFLAKYLLEGVARHRPGLEADIQQCARVIERVCDQVAARHGHRLERGDLLVWDNRTHLHGRTPFSSESNGRLLWRFYGGCEAIGIGR